MATTQAVLQSERWLDEVLIFGSIVDVAGATIVENFRLPAGIGDVAILSLLVRAVNIDVMSAVVAPPLGAWALIQSPDAASIADNVGVGRWYSTATGVGVGVMECFIDPDALTLWRQNELLVIEAPELDTDATPTGDLQILAKCVRVRPIEAPASAFLQLVR